MQTIAIIGIAVYFSVAGFLFLFQRRIIYLPDRYQPHPDDYDGTDMRPVTLLTADGLELVAWWRPPATDASPVMVFMHGNAGHIGDRVDKVRPYLGAGWGVLLTSWRGYSGNPGRPSEKGLYADGRAALDFLRGQDIPFLRVVIYGESLGAAVAVQMATEEEVGAVTLEAPFSSIADVARRRFPLFPTRMLLRDRYESIAKVSALKEPLLLVHGRDDEVIPVSLGRKLFEAATHPKEGVFVEGAAHNNLYDFDTHEAVLSFVNEHIRHS